MGKGERKKDRKRKGRKRKRYKIFNFADLTNIPSETVFVTCLKQVLR
jgi:hypothetical protein